MILILTFITVVAILMAIYFGYKLQVNNEEKKELEATAKKAQRLLEAREKFVAYTNHEIRTPLNAVAGSASLLSETELNPRQSKYVKTIKASVDNVLILVNDILDLSRIESGKIEFRNKDFLITDVINGVKYILQERTEKKGIELRTQIDNAIPNILKGDSRYLSQIIINLANNAVKFTDLGSVTIKVTKVSSELNATRVRFDIVDTGKGIRKSKISTIFNQYEQETRHTIKTKGGSGLGLSITKQLVELQNGKIWVDSKYLEGSTFSVELDFNHSKQKKIERETVDYSVLSNLRLLVVDDNQINRDILQDVLINCNPKVKIDLAIDGEKAVQKLAEKDYDLVLMDVQMPIMDGYEATRYIRSNVRNPMNEIPIIAMTAFAMDNVAQECFKAGMNDYIAKPLEPKFLITKIQRLIDKKKASNKEEVTFRHVDLSHLKELTNGDKTKMFKYIDIFLQNVPSEISDLKKAYAAKNTDDVMAALHKLKGNLSYMGNEDLPKTYDKLSNKFYNGDKTLENTKIESCIEEAEKAYNEIKLIKHNYKGLFLDL